MSYTGTCHIPAWCESSCSAAKVMQPVSLANLQDQYCIVEDIRQPSVWVCGYTYILDVVMCHIPVRVLLQCG